MREISSCIDWLSMTYNPKINAGKFIVTIEGYGDNSEVKPQYGYDTAVKYTCGMVVMWSQARHDMGTHIVLSGSTLEALTLAGNNVRTMLKRAIELKAKVTRLDIAIDARDCEIDIAEVYKAAQDAKSQGSVQSINLISGVDGGATLYLGSRQSDKFARLYDKGVQTKDGGDWKRLELELKGDVAKQYARVIAMTDSSIASFVWSIASKMFMTEAGNYPTLGAHSDLVSMPKIEKVTDTEKWLCTQIIPVIEKYVRRHPESTVYDELIAALIRARDSKPD